MFAQLAQIELRLVVRSEGRMKGIAAGKITDLCLQNDCAIGRFKEERDGMEEEWNWLTLKLRERERERK
jgi:hypothetical protein